MIKQKDWGSCFKNKGYSTLHVGKRLVSEFDFPPAKYTYAKTQPKGLVFSQVITLVKMSVQHSGTKVKLK